MAAGMFRAAGGALGFVTAARLFEPGVLIGEEVRIFLFVAGVSFRDFCLVCFWGQKKLATIIIEVIYFVTVEHQTFLLKRSYI